jgi:hypothetical protein
LVSASRFPFFVARLLLFYQMDELPNGALLCFHIVPAVITRATAGNRIVRISYWRLIQPKSGLLEVVSIGGPTRLT